MLTTASVVNDLIGVVIIFLITVIGYYKWKFQYWKRKSVPFFSPSIPFGNLPNPITSKENMGITIKHLYHCMKRKNWQHAGVFMLAKPVYFLVDPESIKNIMVKDFGYFVNRGFYYNEKDDPLSGNLFNLGGPKWKHVRTKVSAIFTSGKLKMMFHTIEKCEKNLQKKMDKESSKKKAINVKEVLDSFTIDIIGSCGFSLDCDSFASEDSPFKAYGRKAVETSRLESLKQLTASNFPILAKKLCVSVTAKDVSEFFLRLLKDTVTHREKNNVTQRDFLQLLIDLKNNQSLTIEEIAAQSFGIFLAGFETASSAMTFALYELAKHPEIQDKVREEVDRVLAKHGKITYEAIQEMTYMDQVIDETLRKYPPISFLTRECVKPYKVPDQDLVIEPGTLLFISVMGLHYDEEYFPNPENFDPERFTQEKKAEIKSRYVYLPFGEGPRMCIGLRFGVMQTKVGLASLLKTYIFSLNKKTKEPFKYKVESFILAVDGDIWLDVQKI